MAFLPIAQSLDVTSIARFLGQKLLHFLFSQKNFFYRPVMVTNPCWQARCVATEIISCRR